MAVTLIWTTGCGGPAGSAGTEPLAADVQQPPQSCTVFYAADEEVALGGNNEDWLNPLTKIWFMPPEAGRYGRVYFGFDDFTPQGGMNDQGLFFDGLAVTPMDVPPEEDKPIYQANLVDKAMSECATVACVEELMDRYYKPNFDRFQLLFGDSTGDSAIIEPLTVVRKDGPYQVATNFYQSQTSEGSRTCWRYRTAVEMLEDADEFSAELFRNVLEATHQAGEFGSARTLYSTIYDLKRTIVYVYYFHDFEHVVEIDLEEELAQGEHVYDLPSLFPQSDAAARWAQLRIEAFERRRERRVATDIDPRIYSAYVGQYEGPTDSGLTFAASVTSEQGHLYVDLLGDESPRLEMLPQSETSFFYLTYDGDWDLEVTFVQGHAGQVSQAVLEVGERSFRFDRIDVPTAPATEVAADPLQDRETPGRSGSWWMWLLGASLVLSALAVWGITRRQSRC
jgi:hypothetical protein